MPGAISRTTGSATRWNSLTLSFMRQGSDQPLSVTTGWYDRPFGGGGGSCMAADDSVAASGSKAAPARLTVAAPSMVAPAALKNALRLVIAFLLQWASCAEAAAVLGPMAG